MHGHNKRPCFAFYLLKYPHPNSYGNCFVKLVTILGAGGKWFSEVPSGVGERVFSVPRLSVARYVNSFARQSAASNPNLLTRH